jgi:RNA polymerase sigma-70 factor (family 1)
MIPQENQMTIAFSESEIIDGLKNNDSRVCRHLFNKYYPPLLYFTYKLTSDWEESQDIVIHTFNTFWNLRNNFESEVNIKAFMYITCRNKSFDFLKYRQRQIQNKKVYNEFLLENSEEIETLYTQTDLIRKIYLEAENLPEKCKEVFFLTYFSGLKASEIAQQLNLSVSTVTSHRARAIELLRLAFLKKKELPSLILLLGSVSIVKY